MARTLYVLRHAKSDWSEPGLADFQRPLASRGRKQVKRLSSYAEGLEVDLVVTSPAVRTRQTIDPLIPVLGCRLREDLRIYEASAEDLLGVVRDLPADARRVMLVGHNPGVEALVRALTAQVVIFSTAALATLSTDRPWTEADRGTARLDDMMSAKELKVRVAARDD